MSMSKPDSFNVSFFDESTARRHQLSTPLHVVGYGRLSFDEDGEGYLSILNQKDILNDFYEKKLKTRTSQYDFIADDNVSGYKFDRAGLFEVIRRIEKGACNILIAKDLSRIGRHGALTQLFIEQCERAGVRIIAMDDYDSDKESDELILGIRAWSNERLVKDTSAKILKIVRHKQKTGAWFCAAPYGYRVISYASADVAIDEKPAAVLRRIAEMYLSGCGVNRIAKILTEEGVPTPSMHLRDQALADGRAYAKKVGNRWSGAQISKMLDDEFYAGTLITGRYRRQGINGKDVRTTPAEQHTFANHHEPIWPQETWMEIRRKREDRKSQNYRGFKKTESLFHGILVCGECGHRLYTYNRADLARQYICSTYFKYGSNACTRHMIKDSTLTRIALVYLGQLLQKSENLLSSIDQDIQAMRRSKRQATQNADSLRQKISQLRQELAAIESQRVKQILRQPDREEVLNNIYDDMADNTQKSIDRLTDELESITQSSADFSETIRKNRSARAIIESILQEGSLSRRDIELLFDRIIIHEDGRVVVHMKTDLGLAEYKDLTVVDSALNHADRVYEIQTVKDDASGDPLEIYTDHDGEVVLKKYSPIGEIATIARDYTDSLYRSLGHIACICDRDMVVSVSGASKRELWEKPLSHEMENAISNRQTLHLNASANARMIPITNEDDAGSYTAQIVVPIISDGEVIGALAILSKESGVKMSETDLKVAKTTAGIVGRQMEQ